MKYIILVAILLGLSTLYYQTKYDVLKREVDVKVAIQEDQIKRYKKEAAEQIASVSKLNEIYDNDINSVRSAYDRLRKQSQASILPSNPTSTRGSESETLRFDREQLDRAIQDYRLEIQKLIREGDECRAALNTAIEWSKEVDRQR